MCDVLGTPPISLPKDEAAMLFCYWYAGRTSDHFSSLTSTVTVNNQDEAEHYVVL